MMTQPHPYPCPRDPEGVPYDPRVQETEEWRAVRVLPPLPPAIEEHVPLTLLPPDNPILDGEI